MSTLVYVPFVADAAPSTSLTWVIVVKSTVVLAGSNVSPELPLDACNCTETKPTRYARKLSGDAVLVIVTTAVPLQPGSASKGAASTVLQARRAVEKTAARDAYIRWI